MDKIYLYKPISIFQCIAGEWLWRDKIGFAFLKQICLQKGKHFYPPPPKKESILARDESKYWRTQRGHKGSKWSLES